MGNQNSNSFIISKKQNFEGGSDIQLPLEIWLKIFYYLSPEDLCFSVPCVCKTFKLLSEDNYIWSAICSKQLKNQNHFILKQLYISWIREQIKIFFRPSKFKYDPSKGILTGPRAGYHYFLRILLVGRSHIGKTSLINSYATGQYGEVTNTIHFDFTIMKTQMQSHILKLLVVNGTRILNII